MKVYDYKKTSPLLWCLVLCMSFFSLTLSAQDDDLACTSQVNVSIGVDCDLGLTPELFTENTDNGPLPTAVRFSFQDPNEQPFPLPGVAEGIECGMYTFTVYDNSNNSCWGTIKIEDKLPPEPPEHLCTPAEPCPATCLNVDSLFAAYLKDIAYFVGNGPTAELNSAIWKECNGPIVILNNYKNLYPAPAAGELDFRNLGWFIKETLTPRDNCAETTVNYIINFKDQKLNKGADTFTYTVQNITIDDMLTAPPTYFGSCDDDDISPNVTGIPSLGGTATSAVLNFSEELDGNKTGGTAQVCNILISYWDVKHLAACVVDDGDNNVNTPCGESKKVIREWTVIDWCNGGIVPWGDGGDVQLIELKDTIDPVVMDDAETVSTDPWKCAGEITVFVEAIDTCSGAFLNDADELVDFDGLLYTMTGPAGVSISNSGERGDNKFVIKHAPAGVHVFKMYAADCCGNQGEGEFVLTVTDEVKPFAIAKEFTVTSVIKDPTDPGEAIAKVYWGSIDNGSWDACSDLEYYVRRMDGDLKRETWPNGPILRISNSNSNPIHCDDKDIFPTNWDDNANTSTPDIDGAIAAFSDDVEVRTNGEVQYNGDEWGELVKFCCSDFGTSPDGNDEYRVELIVFDRAGNWNITWGWVKIEDPTPPTPMYKDYTAYCHDEVLNGPISGAIDRLCEEAEKLVKFVGCCDVEFPFVKVKTDGLWYDETCKFGEFYITWRATNPSKGTQTTIRQKVTIEYKDDFACHDIHGWRYWDTPVEDDAPDWYNTNGTVRDGYYDYRDLLNVECEPPAPQDLTWDAGPCVLVGWTMESDTFQFETDACKKIENKWTVVDWCVYDAHGNTGGFNIYDYWKEYKDAGRPSLTGGNDYCDSYWSLPHGASRSVAPGYWVPHWGTGVYKWRQLIKVSEDDAPVIDPFDNDMKIDSFLADCGTPLSLTLSASDTGDCPADWFKWELFRLDAYGTDDQTAVSRGIRTGVEVTWNNILPAAGPKTSRWYRAKVWDGCGNVDIYEFQWKINDKKAPTPYCINLSTALMVDPDGDGPMVPMVELWACDFDENSYDNCTHDTLLFHTFDGVAPGIGWLSNSVGYAYNYDQYYRDGALLYYYRSGRWYIGTSTSNWVNTSTEWDAFDAIELAYLTGDDTDGEIYFWDAYSEVCGYYTAGKVFTEDELDNGDTDGDGNVDVRVDVWDGCFNTDWCSVQLTLRCTTCGGGGAVANVSGAIATEAGSDVASVEVTLDNLTNPEYKLTKVTGNDGIYAFASNPMYNGYDISAIKSGDDDEGVSTLDLVMIQRHILGLAAFSSPYKVIASDINNNGDVSATDLIVLRKLILGIYKEFPQNESWRFVDAGQSLTTENALENFSEILNIAELDANMTNEDFIAVKIGDVNGDAKTNARRTETQVRNANKVALSIEDRNVKAGEVVNITFGSNEFSEVYGYQFTIDLNGLQFEAVKAGAANMTNDNVALLDANTLTVSYADINGLNASDNIFTIAAVATKDGAISEMININSSRLNSEAYVGTSLDIATVELTLEGKVAAAFELGQNEPNPFNDFTVVGFTLPEAGEAQITVFNVAGKVITSRFGEYAQGYNQEKFNKTELGVSGVLYYTLESGDFTATKKMIIIE